MPRRSLMAALLSTEHSQCREHDYVRYSPSSRRLRRSLRNSVRGHERSFQRQVAMRIFETTAHAAFSFAWAQCLGCRPRMRSKPCFMAAKRSSILGSNSVSNVRPVVFDAFPNQFADVEWIDTLGYPFAQRFDILGDGSFRRQVFNSAGEPLREIAP
jgi:hypothetical protein